MMKSFRIAATRSFAVVSLALVTWVCGAEPSTAEEDLRGVISYSPPTAQVGSPFRVRAILYNPTSERIRTVAQIWTVRPQGQRHLLGSVRVSLPPRERTVVIIPSRVHRGVSPGRYAIGLVLAGTDGRFIADTARIAILPITAVTRPPVVR